MKPQPAGANLLEGTALHFRGIGTYTGVPQNNFDTADARAILGAVQVATSHFNGAAGFPPVGVTHDIGKGLIHGAHNGARLLLVKMQNLRRTLDSSAHQAERLRVALQLQLEEQL